MEYFSNHGQVVHVKYKLDPKTGFFPQNASVYFDSKKSIEKILESEHFIQDQKVQVTPDSDLKISF